MLAIVPSTIGYTFTGQICHMTIRKRSRSSRDRRRRTCSHRRVTMSHRHRTPSVRRAVTMATPAISSRIRMRHALHDRLRSLATLQETMTSDVQVRKTLMHSCISYTRNQGPMPYRVHIPALMCLFVGCATYIGRPCRFVCNAPTFG